LRPWTYLRSWFAAVSLVLLTFFIRRSEAGVGMRAASQDLLAARLMGININRVIVPCFRHRLRFGRVVGVLWSIRVGKIDPLMGFYQSSKRSWRQ